FEKNRRQNSQQNIETQSNGYTWIFRSNLGAGLKKLIDLFKIKSFTSENSEKKNIHKTKKETIKCNNLICTKISHFFSKISEKFFHRNNENSIVNKNCSTNSLDSQKIDNKNHQLNEVQLTDSLDSQKIDNKNHPLNEVRSFDVFDTLIGRKHQDP